MKISSEAGLRHLPGIIETNYGISGKILQLSGYQDLNYQISDKSGENFVIKISVDPDDLAFIRSQNRILLALSALPVGVYIPIPSPTIHGEYLIDVTIDNKPAIARVFKYLEGSFLAETNPDFSLYTQLGRVFAQIDQGMTGQEDAVLKSHTHLWDLGRVLELEDDVSLISNPEDRRLVQYFLMKFREEVQPIYHRLPKGLIHGDGNDWNILVNDGHSVAGILDFGDMVWSARINEVAILSAYALIGCQDPHQVLQYIIQGYEQITQLSTIEIQILFHLIAARWCQTLLMAARQERQNPKSAYHQISVQGARSMLHYWIRENPLKLTGLSGKDDLTHRDSLCGTEEESHSKKIEKRYRYFSKAVSLSYKDPIFMTGAAMQYMYSSDGKTYLDCVNNIPHVGHCHPRVVEAGQRQMARLNTNTRYLYQSLDRYAEKLLSKFPPSLNKVFFVNSGSAATDLAVRLAESYTGQCNYLVLDYAYHGNTKAAIGLSPYKFNRRGGKGKPENVTIIHPRKNTQSPLLQDLAKQTTFTPQTFFAESIIGCAGQILLPAEFMQQTTTEVRSHGGIYVADEVQTGFGRVGKAFWAYQLYNVVPDIVILGKPMGNGHPMGAVVCTEAIARSFETGMEFFSSFGGNPVSCEIGLAVLDVIEEEGLQQNADKIGDLLLREISRQLAPGKHHAESTPFVVSEVRGSGLFLGIELLDYESNSPATEAASQIVNSMKRRGFLLSTDGPFNNVIKFKPPMCFSQKNAEELLAAFKVVMG